MSFPQDDMFSSKSVESLVGHYDAEREKHPPKLPGDLFEENEQLFIVENGISRPGKAKNTAKVTSRLRKKK